MDYNVVTKFIRNRFHRGYNNTEYMNKLTVWLDWYKGYVKEFHTMQLSNGITSPKRDMKRLNMAKRVCEDWKNAVISEDMVITVNSRNKKSSIFVQGSKGTGGVLGSNNFQFILSETVEQMFALGTGAFVLSLEGVAVDENGNIVAVTQDSKISVSGYNATSIIPISWKNKAIKECAFVGELEHQGNTYYTLSCHVIEDGYYSIYNYILNLSGNMVSLADMPVIPYIKTRSKNPLFYIIKTGIVNNVDLNSPLGVSIYANAIDNLRGCDILYDACLVEVQTGQRLVFFAKCMLTTTEDGTPIVPHDARQYFFQFIGDDVQRDLKKYVEEFHPDINVDKLDQELQNQLNMLSMKVGLGTNFYNFELSNGVTATEYIGSRNDFIRSLTTMTRSVSTAIKNMTQGILFLGHDILGVQVDPDAKIDIRVNDGVVESDKEQREMDRQDVKDGLMSKVEYRVKWYGETEDEAALAIAKIEGVEPASQASQEEV